MPLFRRPPPDEPFAALPPVTLAPIGWVRTEITDPNRDDWSRVRSRIVLADDLRPALTGLDGFSHIIVVTWLDRVPEALRRRQAIHPAGDLSLPLTGTLALRTQHRPNPIGVTVVPLEKIEGVVLHVRGLDAVDRTPVLDIKPYIPHYDSVPAARLPDWAGG